MAKVMYNYYSQKIVIENGIKKFEPKINRNDCAQFIASYPENDIINGVEQRSFRINVEENAEGSNITSHTMMDNVKWWWPIMKERLNLQFLNLVGIENDRDLIITLKNISLPEDNNLRRVYYKQALLEFGLLRMAWGNPYYFMIAHIRNAKDEIVAAGYDYMQFLFFYNFIVRFVTMHMELSGKDGCDVATWSQYFSLIYSEAHADTFYMPTFEQMKELMAFRESYLNFSIFELTHMKIIKPKEPVLCVNFIENVSSKVFREYFNVPRNILSCREENSKLILEQSLKFLKDEGIKS
jgi:hypothetical protein